MGGLPIKQVGNNHLHLTLCGAAGFKLGEAVVENSHVLKYNTYYVAEHDLRLTHSASFCLRSGGIAQEVPPDLTH
jgi:hypothetical protein